MANYRKLSDRVAVLKAINEYDKLGRAKFLENYGYGKALRFVLLHNGRQYDSKAIVGAAYQFQFSEPLLNTEFSGGQSIVPILESMGFKVIDQEFNDNNSALAEEITDSMWEGAKRTIYVNAYERSADARNACIKAHGSSCAICAFDFAKVYGPEFMGFIHVHHRVPVSKKIGARYKVDPKKDLVPLCPNCHAVVHYGNKTRTENEVKKLIQKFNKSLDKK